MNEFWADFFLPLTFEVLALSVVLGVIAGMVAFSFRHVAIAYGHLYWQAAGGAIFFIPLSFLRAFQGSDHWARFLATYVLWLVFIGGMLLGDRIRARIK